MDCTQLKNELTDGKFMSIFFMCLNMIFWTIIIIPQLYKNYQLKSSNAVSYFLILFWFIGSILNIISAYLKNVTVVIIYSAIHSLIIDLIVIVQLLYYRWYRKTYINFLESLITISLLILVFVLIIILVYVPDKLILADIIAWITVFIFSIARVPQIYLNYKRKSVQGLSFFAFVCVTLTNVFFILSIIVNVVDTSFQELFIKNLQWIICSITTLVFDIILLSQFFIYKQHTTGYTEIGTDV